MKILFCVALFSDIAFACYSRPKPIPVPFTPKPCTDVACIDYNLVEEYVHYSDTQCDVKAVANDSTGLCVGECRWIDTCYSKCEVLGDCNYTVPKNDGVWKIPAVSSQGEFSDWGMSRSAEARLNKMYIIYFIRSIVMRNVSFDSDCIMTYRYGEYVYKTSLFDPSLERTRFDSYGCLYHSSPDRVIPFYTHFHVVRRCGKEISCKGCQFSININSPKYGICLSGTASAGDARAIFRDRKAKCSSSFKIDHSIVVTRDEV